MLQIYPCVMIEYAPRVPMQPCPCTIMKHRCVSVATEQRSVCGVTVGSTVSDSCVRCFCGCHGV